MSSRNIFICSTCSRISRVVVIGVCLLTAPVWSQDRPDPNPPQIAPASNEGVRAIGQFKIPAGFKAELVAAEPMLANPVAFCIDPQGRFYICETFRQQKGVEDNRSHMNWLLDDLALESVEQRLEMFKKYLGDDVQKYALEDDRIRMLEDTDGDGKADRDTVFASGFNGIVEGTGAGVVEHEGSIYFTNIPKLWRLTDSNADGVADDRIPLHHGYGVRVAFRGHDMHGLIVGPDGRIYYSIGDRGYNVVTPDGRRLFRPDTGAVFRCQPDGTELEVFAYGLRNPQELAFDDFGNLFTGDNNSDSGDQARWVYVVEGGDTGWRMYYQYLNDRGPWNREKIWHPQNPDQPAATIPPIVNLADGPSGLVAYPGVGLSERYRGHFFLADFRGSSANSGIRSFAVKPRGAAFELTDSHQFIWSILATDVDFGYDGAMYLTDWVDGWNGPGKGRLYRFHDPEHIQAANAAGAARIMRDGLVNATTDQLLELLAHPDRRIRQQAQFALVNAERTDALIAAANSQDHQFSRIHAIWGLGQRARSGDSKAASAVAALIDSSDDELAAQSLRVAADIIGTARQFAEPDEAYEQNVLNLAAGQLAHGNARVRYFAAMALGKIGDPKSIPDLLSLLDENADKDVFLRHAGVMGLTGIASNSPESVEAAAGHTGASGRLGVLLALRRIQSPQLTQFLRDGEARIVLEAARAIHDEPIPDGMAALAALASQPSLPDPLLRRVLSANYRLGGLEQARAVAAIAADASVSEPLRLEAIEELKSWNKPEPLDRVLGAWRPIERTAAIDLKPILRPALGGILAATEKVRAAGVQLAALYGIKEIGPVLAELAADPKSAAEVRVEALRALAELGHDQLEQLAESAITDPHARVRANGRFVLAKLNPGKAVKLLDAAIADGKLIERQSAIRTLAELNRPAADEVLLAWLDRLVKRDVTVEIQLDLLNAAAARKSSEFQERVQRFNETRPANDPLAQFRESLAGGDAERGREIFYGRSAVSCRRCHAIAGNGGLVGPELTKVGLEKDREYILESIVDPNRKIAKGFETVILAMLDGKVYAGIVKEENPDELKLMTNEGAVVVIDKSEIDDRAVGRSGMPEDLIKQLSKDDVRDLVEYLATRKGQNSDAARHGE